MGRSSTIEPSYSDPIRTQVNFARVDNTSVTEYVEDMFPTSIIQLFLVPPQLRLVGS